MLKKDKAKVLGESFSDERIKGFLHGLAHGNDELDYCLLERAYRGMIPENFERFLTFFGEAGKDIQAKNAEGDSLLTVIRHHRLGEEYAQALRNAGAQD